MPGCFHVGCESGYGIHYKPCHLFKLPKHASDDVKQEWLRNIPKRKGVKFDVQKNTLCHLHFDDKFIIKTVFINYGGAGGEHLVPFERKNWTLTNDAVPTLFANEKVSSLYNRSVPKRRSTTNRREPVPKKSKPSTVPDNVRQHVLEMDVNLKDIEDMDSSSSNPNEIEAIVPPVGWQTIGSDGNGSATFYKLGRITEDLFYDIHKFVKVIRKDNGNFHMDVFFNGTPLNEPAFEELTSYFQVTRLLHTINLMNTCTGISKFSNIHSCKSGKKRGSVWFSLKCQARVNCEGERCQECDKLYAILRTLASRERQKLSTITRIRSTPSNPQHAAIYVKNLKRTLTSTRRNLTRNKTNSARARLSISLLKKQMKSKKETDMLKSIEATDIPDNFKLAMKTAVKNAKRKSSTGNRFEAEWLLQCMLLKIKSPQAYRHLRNNQMLPLPHPSTLQRLIQGMPCEFGFSDQIFQQLKNEYSNKSIKEREGVVMFDEIKVRQELAYDKFSCQFNGFIDYGGECEAKESSALADHALVFMFKPHFQNTVQPLASFATKGAAPGAVLGKLLLSCVARLESSGLRISGVISDGATTNRNMWKILGIKGDCNNTINKIKHPFSDDVSRWLYFFSDVPHIIKCIRNHFFKHKILKYRGEQINSGYYEATYDIDKKLSTGLRVVPKLTDAHISPSSFQKMRVSLAVQVFSKTMADGINFYRNRGERFLVGSEVTERFTRDMNDLFDALNARHSAAGVKLNSTEYQVIRNFREILTFEDCYNSFASDVTLASMRVTLQSFLEIIDYLSNLGFRFILTGKISQDSLEKFFGILRQVAGDEDHPTVISFMHLFRLLSIYTPTAKLIRGNVTTGEDVPLAMKNYMDVLLRKRKDQMNISKAKRNDIDCRILNKITRFPKLLEGATTSPDQNFSSTGNTDCVVYQLCGYLAHKASTVGRFTKCTNCISTLYSFEVSNAPEAALTRTKSSGYLKYPSASLFQIIQNTVEPKIQARLNKTLHESVVTEIIESLDEIDCTGIGCSAQCHSEDLIVQLIAFYVTIRMYFFAKLYNKEVVTGRAKSKKQRKLAKLN